MTTTAPAVLIPVAPVFTDTERLALAGFLAGYSGLTRQAYELDLRQYASWCHQHHIRLFQARRPDIECFARDLETRGRARATITRRLCTIAGFYRYAVEEDLLDHSPAAHVRRPRLDYESHATGLDRNELGALLVAAGLGSPTEHAPRWAGSRQAHRPDTALMTWPGGALGLPRRGELHNPLECPHAQEAARPHRRRLRPPPGWRRVRPARHARRLRPASSHGCPLAGCVDFHVYVV